jgi:cytochrome c
VSQASITRHESLIHQLVESAKQNQTSIESLINEVRNLTTLAAAAAFALIGFAGQAMAQDAEAGEKSFAKCRACHQIGETAKNSVGPNLNGLIGRHSGAVEGYNYSGANKNSGLTWDEATFKEYIKNPRAKIPGTKMVFAGITNETEIDNLVAYLKQFDKDGKKK